MKRYLVIVAAAVWMAAAGACGTPSQGLGRGVAEEEGVSSRGVLRFVEAAEEEIDALHGFVLVRHGKVIAEGWWSPFERGTPHKLYSLSKSFCATAVGIAADEGRLSVDDAVLSFFPDDVPAQPSENLKAMRVRDLLTMSTGHAKDTLPALTGGKEANWPRAFLALPVEHKPGTHFVYNTGATYMLSAIVQKVTGQTLLEYLEPRLFEPLGIEGPTWETDPRGVSVGGWGLKVTTTDIAKFGQLYLQKGVWDGKRLLSESWVAAATTGQVDNGDNPESDWSQGYGYQFWRSRHDTYRGDGAMGQFCIVIPERDAVLAITAGNKDMQATLNLVWKHLLPAMHDGPLPPDDQARSALTEKLRSLSYPLVEGKAVSPLAAKVAGKRFKAADNDVGIRSVSFDFGENESSIVLGTEAGEQRFVLSPERWREQLVPFQKLGLAVVATSGEESVTASGAWTADDRYTLRAWLTETPYRLEMDFRFDADAGRVTVERRLHPLQEKTTRVEASAE